tara:strand:+ start:227 stop:373 length:147 start_codon:yes stop_codon:yes gene_type:complete
VLEDANQLMGRMGKDDREKMDEYLGAVRELEKRIEQNEIKLEIVPVKL